MEGKKEGERGIAGVPVGLYGLLPLYLFLASGIKWSLEQRDIDRGDQGVMFLLKQKEGLMDVAEP